MFRTYIPLRFWIYILAMCLAGWVFGLGGVVVTVALLALMAKY